jgi:hypothetical protein
MERCLTVEPLGRNGLDFHAKEDICLSDHGKNLCERFHAA